MARPQRLAVLLVALLLAAPGLAPAPQAAAPVPPLVLGGLPELLALFHRFAPAPQEPIARALDLLPPPLGPSPGARLLAEPFVGVSLPRPSVVYTGDVDFDASLDVSGDVTFDHANVRFTRPGLQVRASGTLGALDSSFRTAQALPGWQASLQGGGGLDVQRSLFEGVAVAARWNGTLPTPSLVADSRFANATVGVAVDRPNLEVRGNVFVNVSTGVDVGGAHGRPELGPSVHDNTFEMARAGISVAGASAGVYERNVVRASFLGVFCQSPGADDPQGNPHRPRFDRNNLHTNYGEAIMGLRGITVTTPLGNVVISSSACDHDRPYLGPSGFARDTTFISSDDTINDVQGAPNPTSAPSLPLPITEVTTTETWSGPRALTGPVVVNDPGVLTIDSATLTGAYFVGAKARGRIALTDSVLDPGIAVFFRNALDEATNSALGGPLAEGPLTMWRCNCSFDDGAIAARGLGALVSGGLLTDDTVWRPLLTGSTIRAGAAIAAISATPTFSTDTLEGGTVGLLNALAQTNFNHNTVDRAEVGILGLVGQLTSSDNLYQRGLLGDVSVLDTLSFTRDVFAAWQIAMVPVLPAAATVTLSNLTLNAVGVVPALGVVTMSSTNLVDNYLLALAALPLDAPVPSGITCTNCWGPADEARYGNVTYTANLVPNATPSTPWAGSVIKALAGQTVDLPTLLPAPAVAKNGGTLRVRNTSLDLAQWFAGAKGGGMSGGTTGRVDFDNATITQGGVIPLNSTDSRIVFTRFAGFPDAAVTLLWNGGSFGCVAVEDSGSALRFNLQKAERLEVRRLATERAGPVVAGLLDIVIASQDVLVEDSGQRAPRSGGLLHRIQPGDAQLHRSNLNGASGQDGARDEARDLPGLPVGPMDASDSWWADPLGPGQNGTRMRASGNATPIVAPWATSAFAPTPCAAFDVLTASPDEAAPVEFLDRTIDPSGLGLDHRDWDWGDGTSSDVASARASHAFPDGGSYTVTMTAVSTSGASASATRTVTVADVPPRADFSAAIANETVAVDFTDRSTHPNPNDAPPSGWAYEWDFDGEGSSAQRSPSFRFADGGSKSVTLNVTDDDALSHEVTRTIVVPHVPPVAAFAVTGTQETDTYAFTDQSTHPNAPTDSVTAWHWSCTDGFTSTARNPTHRFADGGSYACTLTVDDDDDQHGTASHTVSVAHVAPHAAFSLPTTDETQDALFEDASTHPNAPSDAPPAGWTYAWDLGDGATSSARDPSHRYDDGGSYAVSLTTTDNDGLADTEDRTITIQHVAPVAAFDVSPETPPPGTDVQFTDRSTHPHAPTDAIVTWAWDFDDGATSSLPSPIHAFADAGQFDVALTVTDDDGQGSTVVHRVNVGNFPPVPAFHHTPTEPTDLDDVSFFDDSTDPDGEVVAWHWDFGDGNATTVRDPVHRFADDGDYPVALTVTDDKGTAATLVRVVVVRNVPPHASFAYEPAFTEAGREVRFTDHSTDPDGQLASWLWDFDDGTTSTERDPRHTWTQRGDYLVTLTVRDDDGAPASFQQRIRVCQTGLILEDGHIGLELCGILGLPPP